MKTLQAVSPANEAGRRRALERFGYSDAPAQPAAAALEHEWALLAPGFAPWLAGSTLAGLSAEQRALAAERVRQRRELDALMRDCDQAHAQIAAGGARPELVEAYATARDRFEEAVEAFAESAEAMAARFRAAT